MNAMTHGLDSAKRVLHPHPVESRTGGTSGAQRVGDPNPGRRSRPLQRWSLRLLLIAMWACLPANVWALPITMRHIAGVGDFKDPFVPDFYQHQKAGDNANQALERDVRFNDAAPRPGVVPDYATTPNWWENGGGWCCVVALVNSFYFLEEAYGIEGLFTRADKEAEFQRAQGRAPTWQERMIFAIEDLAKDMGLTGLPGLADPAIPRHVRKLEDAATFPAGSPYHKLTYSEFMLDTGRVFERKADPLGALAPATNVSASYRSLFDVYRAELCRSEDVTITIQYPEARRLAVIATVRTREAAERAALGRDLTDAEFDAIVRDVLGPDLPWWFFSFHVMTGAGIADCTDPTDQRLFVADPDKRNRLVGNAYVDEDLRTRYPYDAATPFPSGLIHYETLELNASGCITSALYRDACITLVRAISPVVEPATLHIVWLGILAVAWARRRGIRNFRNERPRTFG
jgi:hypothetical protein